MCTLKKHTLKIMSKAIKSTYHLKTRTRYLQLRNKRVKDDHRVRDDNFSTSQYRPIKYALPFQLCILNSEIGNIPDSLSTDHTIAGRD